MFYSNSLLQVHFSLPSWDIKITSSTVSCWHSFIYLFISSLVFLLLYVLVTLNPLFHSVVEMFWFMPTIILKDLWNKSYPSNYIKVSIMYFFTSAGRHWITQNKCGWVHLKSSTDVPLSNTSQFTNLTWDWSQFRPRSPTTECKRRSHSASAVSIVA